MRSTPAPPFDDSVIVDLVRVKFHLSLEHHLALEQKKMKTKLLFHAALPVVLLARWATQRQHALQALPKDYQKPALSGLAAHGRGRSV